jgi:phosphonoacetate hydrolase
MTTPQRILISMIDGFGTDYFEASPLPNLNRMAASGFLRNVQAVVPSVQSANNVSMALRRLPSGHGITGNYYYNEADGQHDYMENAEFIRVPTMMQRAAARHPIGPAHLQEKTLNLLAGGCEIALAARHPQRNTWPASPAPDIYSRKSLLLWRVPSTSSQSS